MSRLSRRSLAVIGAGAFAVALTVGGAGSAVAAPTAGPIETMQDLKGGWLTSLTGFREGDPISWLHRLTVRKVNGSAAVAWEEWLDCALQAADCKAAKAGKQTGVDWSKPSRVLLAMDPKGVVYGVGAYSSIMLTSGGDGMSAVVFSNGQRDEWTATPTTSGQSQTAPAARENQPRKLAYWTGSYAAAGPTVSCSNNMKRP
ncbi:MAG: hypothetical protein F2840_10550 [Actinobacteria bacterium]|uniref:Unannotated protein n=1 Tax=freshwater metagenome TaxID=449393 RepID=A0A6J7KW16_9ZZZZ|nr:hypothetical protein [Actinomycetota bacterium]